MPAWCPGREKRKAPPWGQRPRTAPKSGQNPGPPKRGMPHVVLIQFFWMTSRGDDANGLGRFQDAGRGYQWIPAKLKMLNKSNTKRSGRFLWRLVGQGVIFVTDLSTHQAPGAFRSQAARARASFFGLRRLIAVASKRWRLWGPAGVCCSKLSQGVAVRRSVGGQGGEQGIRRFSTRLADPQENRAGPPGQKSGWPSSLELAAVTARSRRC